MSLKRETADRDWHFELKIFADVHCIEIHFIRLAAILQHWIYIVWSIKTNPHFEPKERTVSAVNKSKYFFCFYSLWRVIVKYSHMHYIYIYTHTIYAWMTQRHSWNEIHDSRFFILDGWNANPMLDESKPLKSSFFFSCFKILI